MTSPSFRRDLALVAAVSALVLFFGLGSGSLRDWDEAIYAQVAREMFEAGDWLTPRLEGRSWFHKPPLYLWLTIAGYHVFGVGELAPRLGSALAGIAAVVFVFLFGRQAFGRTAGIVAAAAFLGTPLLLKLAKTGMLDVLLTAAFAGAFLAWWRSEREPRWLLAVGAALGVAALTKGAAAGLGVLVLMAHLVVAGRYRVFACPWLWGGVALALAISAPWHVHQLVLHGTPFWDEYVGYHVISRAGGSLEGNTGGPAFHLAVLADEGRPWSWLAAVTLPWAAWSAWRTEASALRLVVAWAVIGLLLPSLMSTKIDWYVLPAVPALALSIGWAAQAALAERHHPRIVAVALLLLLVSVATTKRVWNLDYSGDVKRLAEVHGQLVGPSDRLCVYRMSHPAPRFYFERRVRSVRRSDDERLAEMRARTPRLVCITKVRLLEELTVLGAEPLAREGKLALAAFPGSPER